MADLKISEVLQPNEFTITFGKTGGEKKTLHVDNSELTMLADVFCKILNENGLRTFVTTENP